VSNIVNLLFYICRSIHIQMTTIIAAIGKNNALGKNNQLIWHLPADLKRFQQKTTGHHILMGRATFESLGRPLPNRTTVIITRDPTYVMAGCIVVHSLEAALQAAKNDSHPYIIGGAQIYTQAIDWADRLDITFVDQEFEADVFFPKINPVIWKETHREKHQADDKNNYDYDFVTFERRAC